VVLLRLLEAVFGAEAHGRLEAPLLPLADGLGSGFPRGAALAPPVHMYVVALNQLLRRDYLVLELLLDVHVLVVLVVAGRPDGLTRIEVAQRCCRTRDDLRVAQDLSDFKVLRGIIHVN
jgi:hypothetical protein